ncbi:hypothetical protein TcCL_NonESM01528 [Trypanosoma cruzi]|uniref:Uncharacterized protein n=2 Tax=Trypanosoma cruzi TaxID=5693 RepID=Q4DS38_TRYCC|nr:hypothetical protein, conserved [Trypanosoma cruzi]EAN95346.1 hypothetical protein, conserved [Trypanosoma cruzi]RNC48488.1 hypothetical protein TcCL_NonESM01528 [Trypanosoma cruzi]|eukprot:XP_817197.1 hypothetical protein [Trypanosoma cruzi strain CL Brener]
MADLSTATTVVNTINVAFIVFDDYVVTGGLYKRFKLKASTMQLNLPPPPLINITFSGQPAISTGVVNLRVLLGSMDYVLVKHIQGEENHADISDNTDADGVISSGRRQRQLQVCEHAGQPLGCFLVEAGGSYEVVRHDDLQWGLSSGSLQNGGPAVGKRKKSPEEQRGGKEELADPHRKRKRERKQQGLEEKAGEVGKEKKRSRISRHREEKKSAMMAVVSAAVEKSNVNEKDDNDGNDAPLREEKEANGQEMYAVQEGNEVENTAGEDATTPLQRVHLETPPSHSTPVPLEEKLKAREGLVGKKAVSPLLVESRSPVLKEKRHRHLRESLSSSSACGPDEMKSQNQPLEQQDGEKKEENQRKRNHSKSATHRGSGVTGTVLEGVNGAATSPRSRASTADKRKETHPPRVGTTTTTTDPFGNADENVGRNPPRKRLERGTSATVEAEKDVGNVHTDAHGSSHVSPNGWAPNESPALGFTSVNNTLSQDFSLDSSSITSSADYVY